jgi:hypothetical protein
LDIVEILLQGPVGVEYNQVKVQRLKQYVLTLNDDIGGKEILHGRNRKRNYIEEVIQSRTHDE